MSASKDHNYSNADIASKRMVKFRQSEFRAFVDAIQETNKPFNWKEN